jgi:molecular chaperone Hsp33
MIKKELPGLSKKERLKAKAKDRLYNFILGEGLVRGAVVLGTFMIKEMRYNHDLGILETLALGHAYLAAALLTANLKDRDRIALKIECEGPIKGISVESTYSGEVRGYLKNNPIPIERVPESFDLSPYFGEGYLMVTHYPEFAKHPYVGHVKLIHGSIALNLANYYFSSEQTPTSFNLSIKFDTEGNVTGAGGLFLQALPGTDEETIGQLEDLVNGLPSIGKVFSGEQSPDEFIFHHFDAFSPKILADRRVEFFCPCRKDTIDRMLANLPPETLKDLLEQGPFPVETRCHNCNTFYYFEKEEIAAFLKRRA